MMKPIITSVCLAILFACSPKSVEQCVTLFDVDDFTAEVDGKTTSLYTLQAGEILMQVTNFGGRVVSLWTPDKEGRYEDIVLGYNNIDSYINNPGERFLGAFVGPMSALTFWSKFGANFKK